MAQNTQQLRTREELSSCPSMETQLSHITAMLNKLVTGGVQNAVMCGICCLEGHATDACSTLQGRDVNAVFSNQTQKKYDPYSSTYSEG